MIFKGSTTLDVRQLTTIRGYHLGAQAQQSPVVAEVPGSSKVNLSDLHQPTINEVAAMVAHFRGWRNPTFVTALSITGYVHRTKWSGGETKITEDDLIRMNRCLARHLAIEIRSNRNFFWFAKTGGSEQTS